MLLTKRSHAINLLPKTCCFEVKYLVNNWPITSLLRYYHAFRFRGKFGGKFNIPCGRFFISFKHYCEKKPGVHHLNTQLYQSAFNFILLFENPCALYLALLYKQFQPDRLHASYGLLQPWENRVLF